MDVTESGQIFYAEEADKLVPDGCIAFGNEHGGCLARGCLWCLVYYDGPQALREEQLDDFNADYDF